MSRKLIRKPVGRHRFRPHRWEDVDGIAGLFGLVSQCGRCHLVRVFNPITCSEYEGSHEMLEADR